MHISLKIVECCVANVISSRMTQYWKKPLTKQICNTEYLSQKLRPPRLASGVIPNTKPRKVYFPVVRIRKFRWKKPSPRRDTNFPESTSGGRETFGATAELTSLLVILPSKLYSGLVLRMMDEQVAKNAAQSVSRALSQIMCRSAPSGSVQTAAFSSSSSFRANSS